MPSSVTSPRAIFTQCLATGKKNSGDHTKEPHTSINQQIQYSTEPAAAEVACLLERIKDDPAAYDGVRQRLREILLEEKNQVEQAIEDLLDLKFELEEEEEEKLKHCGAKELEWLDRDLDNAKAGISDAIKRKRESLGTK